MKVCVIGLGYIGFPLAVVLALALPILAYGQTATAPAASQLGVTVTDAATYPDVTLAVTVPAEAKPGRRRRRLPGLRRRLRGAPSPGAPAGVPAPVSGGKILSSFSVMFCPRFLAG